MATKASSKGKKTKESAPKKDKEKAPRAKAAEKEAPKPVELDEDSDDDGDDDDVVVSAKAEKSEKPAAPAKKPAPRGRPVLDDPPPVVPARRLTPEAKARVNEMVKKGVSLGEALRAAASWETFVAPVKEDPVKGGPPGPGGGRPFDSGGKPPIDEDETAEEEPATDSDD